MVLADSPSQYYRLDETSGTIAASSSGNGANASYAGTAGVDYNLGQTPGPIAADTRGWYQSLGTTASHGVAAPAVTGATNMSSWTIEVWVNLTALPASYATIAGNGYKNRLLISHSGKLLYQGATGSNLFSATVLKAGTLYHVALKSDLAAGAHGVVSFTINGAKDVNTLSYTSALNRQGMIKPYYWGQYDTSVYYKLNGYLGRAAYYTTALSDVRISAHYAQGIATPAPATPSPAASPVNYPSTILADGPTAYYRLDDTGTTAADLSGNNISGTVGSSVTLSAPGLLTSSDTAMSFPGMASAAGVVQIAPNQLLQPSAAISFEVWLKTASNPSANSVVIAYGSASAPVPYDLYFDASGHIDAQFNLSNGALILSSPNPLSANTIYHIAATFDGTTGNLYVNGVLVASSSSAGTLTGYQPSYGFTIGDDAGFSAPAFNGTIDEVAVYAGKALTAAQVQNHYNAGTAVQPTPSPAPAYSDWNTFGYDLHRTGYNPNETTLSNSNVTSTSLHQVWATDLGAAITAQPLLATGVSINGTPTNVLYIGAENDVFYAINADTGAILWNTALGSPLATSCSDLPNNQFGITGTAAFDRNAGVVYVGDANDNVDALSMTTGAVQWSVNALYDPNTNTTVGSFSQDHIYTAITLNSNNGMLYVATGSFCDHAPWHGRIVAVNTATHAVAAAFFPGRTIGGASGNAYCGGGIWGMGGASIDTTTNDVFVATGNVATTTSGGCTSNPNGETYPYGDAVIQLDPLLNLIGYDIANVNGVKVSNDSDYGATPMLYTVPNCPSLQLSAKNKNGYLYTYAVSGTGITEEQQLHVGNTTSAGTFIGVPAFSPAVNLAYVGNPNGNGNFAHGLNALAQNGGGCTGLNLAWKASIGSSNVLSDDNQAPTVANSVVYFTDGLDNKVWAFDAASGTQLWNSGTLIGSPCASFGGACGAFSAPMVDGRLFVGSWNHKLYAFGL